MWNPFSPRPRNRNRRNDNGQSSIVEPGVRLGTLEDVAGSGTAPIVSVSVGTTGLKRAQLYHKRMDAMNCATRIQSMLLYDCNQVNINKLREEAAKADIADKIIVPEYLPFSEGFLRRVDQYESHYGAIERDMERMVEKMERQSLIAGTEPQVILEWIGFGGHAMLSYVLHDIVTKRFPEASILPIVCFPEDRGLHRNIREREIWDEATAMLRKDGKDIAVLLSDNRMGADFNQLDESLITSLAAVEACFKYEAAAGSLAEVTSVFNITGSRWIVVENTEIPIINREALRQRNGKQSPENHNRAMSKLAQKIKDRIFEIAEPENRFAKSASFALGTHDNEQRIYVTMPLEDYEVKEIREDIEDQLKREEFSKSFPGTQIAYADGNPQTDTPENCVYVHIVKFVGLAAEPQPPSLTSILYDKRLPDDLVNRNRGSVKTRGQKVFEEHQHEYTAGAGTDGAPAEDTASAGTDGASPMDSASAGMDDAPTEDAASADMDDASPVDAASAGMDDATTENTAGPGTAGASPVDAASAGMDDAPTEDAANAGAADASVEDTTSAETADVPAEEEAGVEAEGVESDSDLVADGESPATA